MDNKLLQTAIEDLVTRYRTAGYFPSASIRAFRKDQVLASVNAGDTTDDSLFDVASLTKIATTTIILQMIDRGMLSLRDPMTDLFPEAAHDPWFQKRFAGITLNNLLTHTSTIPDWYPFYAWKGSNFWTVFKAAVLTQPPVSGVVYSDLNYMLLGKLAEDRYGMTLDGILREQVARKLGIENEMMYRPSAGTYRIIPSSFNNQIEMDMCAERNIPFDGWRPLYQPVVGTVNDGNSHYFFDDVAGHAGVFATAHAYQVLCQYYMDSESPLMQLAQKTQTVSPGRGLGFQTTVLYPHGCGHLGFTGTSIYFSTEYNIGVVAMTNRLYYPAPNPQPTNDFRRALHETVFALSRAL